MGRKILVESAFGVLWGRVNGSSINMFFNDVINGDAATAQPSAA